MIKPTRGYVLVEPIEAEEMTSTGVYLPESAKEKPQKGIIIAIGSASSRTDTLNWTFDDAEEGDKVYFKRWGGEEIKEDGKEYKIVRFEDILAVIN